MSAPTARGLSPRVRGYPRCLVQLEVYPRVCGDTIWTVQPFG